MEIFINEHATVEKVVDGVAVVTVRIPVEMLDDVLALCDHILHITRWLRVRSRMKAPKVVAPYPAQWRRVNG